MRFGKIICLLAITLSFPSEGLADCANPAGPEGRLFYNSEQNVFQYCRGTDWIAIGELNPGAGGAGCTGPAAAEGRVIYNYDYHVLQYCDGDDWIAMGYGGTCTPAACTPPALCPNVGDVCDDGNAGTANDPVFAGFIVYNDPNSADTGRCKPLFATNAYQSTSSNWKTSTGVDDIATDSNEDGKFNDAQIPDDTAFPAFKLCKDLTDGGFTDWYLPARDELHVLWNNRVAIGNFTTDMLWASTESGVTSGYTRSFNSAGLDGTSSKNNARYVRCVRRDPSDDTTPDPFNFTDQADLALTTLTASSIVQITGITGSVATSITGGGSPEYRICTDGTSGANCDGSVVQNWTSGSVTIQNNQYLQLRLTSSASNSTMLSATVTVGTGSDQWHVTTVAGTCAFDTWTARDSNRDWLGAASSSDGAKLAAVVQGGRIYTSTDSGANWTQRDSIRNWQTIASSGDGAALVAGVWGGNLYTSADSGANWTARDSVRDWGGVASSANGVKLAAVAYAGRIYTSTDSGVNWTQRDSNREWMHIASSADGTKLAATVWNGYIYTSANSGANWTQQTGSGIRNWNAITSSSDGTRIAATVPGGRIYVSTDSGVTWTAKDSNRNWGAISSSADGAVLAAVVSDLDTSATGRIYISTDSGDTWSPVESNWLWAGIAVSGDGTRMAATVHGGQIYTSSCP